MLTFPFACFMVCMAGMVQIAAASGRLVSESDMMGCDKFIQIAAAIEEDPEGALYGPSQYLAEGFQIWQDTVNKQNGIHVAEQRYCINITVFAAGSTPETVANTCESISRGDFGKFTMLLGPWSSFLTAPCSLEAQKHGQFMSAHGASVGVYVCQKDDAQCAANSKVEGARRVETLYSSSVNSANHLTGPIEVFKFQGASTIGIIHESDPYSSSVAAAAAQFAPQLSIEVVYNSNIGSSINVTTALKFAKELKEINPDVVLAGTLRLPTCISLVKAFKQINYFPKGMAMTLCVSNPGFDEELGEDARYIITVGHWDERLKGEDFKAPLASPNSLPMWLPEDTKSSPIVFRDAFIEKFGHSPTLQGVVAAANGLVMQKAIESGQSVDPAAIMRNIDLLYTPSFFGRLRYDIWGTLTGNMVTWQVDGQLQHQIMKPYSAATATLVYPAPNWDERVYVRRPLDGVEIATTVIGAVGLLICLVVMAITGLKREHAIFKAATSSFCMMILTGCLLILLSITFSRLDASTASCVSTIWLLSYGFVLTYSALFIKTYRLNLIFNSDSIRVVKFSNFKMSIFVGTAMFIESVYNLIWMLAAFPAPELVTVDPVRPSLSYHECNISSPFLYASILVKAAFLLGMLAVTWKVRNVSYAFNETQYIAASIYGVFFVAAMVLPIVLSGAVGDRKGEFALQGFGQFVGVMSIVLILFGPKLYFLLNPVAYREAKISTTVTSKLVVSASKETGAKNAQDAELTRLKEQVAQLKHELKEARQKTPQKNELHALVPVSN